jgi:SAM-dependent methyltransferase
MPNTPTTSPTSHSANTRPAPAAGACCAPGCCPPAAGASAAKATAVPVPAAASADPEAVRAAVREGYGAIAERGTWDPAPVLAFRADLPSDTNDPHDDPSSPRSCCGPTPAGSGGGCCGMTGASAEALAAAIGYSPAEVAALPEGSNMGLSCGNPGAIAALRPGEVVLDLGSGGGFDCFLAGPKVGAAGRVIGVDMTPAMLAKARRNVAHYRAATGLDNVEFRLGEIEHLPLADASVDVVISNCVLNLSPDKPRVWREIARVLRPGGRVAISDLALLRPLPANVAGMVEALVGCVAGASLVDDIERDARDAGLADVTLTPKREYIDALANLGDPLYQRILAALPAGHTPADYVTSVDIAARKR